MHKYTKFTVHQTVFWDQGEGNHLTEPGRSNCLDHYIRSMCLHVPNSGFKCYVPPANFLLTTAVQLVRSLETRSISYNFKWRNFMYVTCASLHGQIHAHKCS